MTQVFLNDNLNNNVNANDFNYKIDNKRFLSSKMNFIDQESNKYITENAFIDLKNNKIAAKDIQIYFADGELGTKCKIKRNFDD